MTGLIKNKSEDINVSVIRCEVTLMSNDEKANIVYIKVDNLTNVDKKIYVSRVSYVNKSREMLECNNWLSGYIGNETTTLHPNSFCKVAAIFYKSRLQNISKGDLLYVVVSIGSETKKVEYKFEKLDDTGWKLINVSNASTSTMEQALEHKIKNNIQRLESLEERLGIEIQNVSIRVDEERCVTVLYEVHGSLGKELTTNPSIDCIIYSVDGSILDKDTNYLDSSFFGFEVFESKFSDDGIANKIGRVLLVPKG